ncbi:hypothetical protein Tco_1337720 [Tanacetum coccineum]
MIEEFCKRLQASNLSTHTPEPSQRFNSIYYDEDDDEASTIPLSEIISQLPLSSTITPILPTMELEDSLIVGNEELITITEKESDEFIKSSVKDICSNPIGVNPFFYEVLEDIENNDPYDSELNEPYLLDIPLSDFNEDECFDPGGDVDEIELLLQRASVTHKE